MGPALAREWERMRVVVEAARALQAVASTAIGEGQPTRPPFNVIVRGREYGALMEALSTLTATEER
jgi:hypothetical protein